MIEFDKATYETFVTRWLGGIDNEVFFWTDFLSRRGGEWPRAYQRRMEPAPACQLDGYVAERDRWPLRVLDVGAGPISNVGVATARGSIALEACDALAAIYAPILDRCGIKEPYVATKFALVERLTDAYDEGAFDVVTVENALDHSFDPFIGIAEMLRVCCLGGHVLLYHAENEAEHEHYNGFHQWNISEQDGRLLIWRGEHRHFADDVFGRFAKIEAKRERLGELWMIRARLEKVAHPPRTVQPLLNAFDDILLKASWRRVGEPATENTDILGLQLEIAALKRTVAELRESTSWKLTAPLRAIASRMRGTGG